MPEVVALPAKLKDAIAVVRAIGDVHSGKDDIRFRLASLSLVNNLLDSFSPHLKDMDLVTAAGWDKEFIAFIKICKKAQSGLPKGTRLHDALEDLIDHAERIEATLDILCIPEMAAAMREYDAAKAAGKTIKTTPWHPSMLTGL